MGLGRRWMGFLEIEIMWWVEWRGMSDSGQWTMLYGPGVGFVDDDDNYRFGFFSIQVCVVPNTDPDLRFYQTISDASS